MSDNEMRDGRSSTGGGVFARVEQCVGRVQYCVSTDGYGDIDVDSMQQAIRGWDIASDMKELTCTDEQGAGNARQYGRHRARECQDQGKTWTPRRSGLASLAPCSRAQTAGNFSTYHPGQSYAVAAAAAGQSRFEMTDVTKTEVAGREID